MLTIIKSKKVSCKKVAHTFLLAFMCFFLAACGAKNVPTNENDNLVSTEDSIYDNYNIAIDDDNIPLLDPEKKALLSRGELDKNLTASELRLVEIYYKSYLHKSRITIRRFMYRALPYLAYTREVFRSRGLPEELAFLAFIESGYNPWAISRSNAMGMWQFMAPTGRQYGLVQDWWMDERRNPYKATHAAAQYLGELYDIFGDWNLAIAAYNAGPGKIGRALEATGATNFFDLVAKNHTMRSGRLRLKEETIQYVPRYLAMIKIMRNFEALGFEPEAHTLKGNKPMITVPGVEVKAKPGTDLASIAKELGMTWTQFSAYNPAFRRYITPPDRETSFYVPYNLQQKAILASKSTPNVGWSTYKVVRGDTLSKISRKTGVPVSVLRTSNIKSEPLKVGSQLRIPGRAGAVNSYVASSNEPEEVSRSQGYTYKVRRGDTFSTIASRHKLTTKQLAAANPSVKNVRNIKSGQRLFIPRTQVAQNTTRQKQANTRQAKVASGSQVNKSASFHTVKSGDTLYSISRKYGISSTDLRNANKQLNANNLRLGQRVNLHADSATAYATYTVKKGDSFTAIARKHGMSVASLAEANPNLRSRSNLALGQKLNVPNSGTLVAQVNSNEVTQKPKAKSSEPTKIYSVKKGDSFHSIARDHGLTQDELADVNPNIVSRTRISIGQRINVPSSSLLTISPQRQAATQATQSYTVRKGDTYWSISQRFGMSSNELLALNKRTKSDILSIGSKIKVHVN